MWRPGLCTLLLIFCIGPSTGFMYSWWSKDYVCASTCSSRFCPFGFLEKGCPRCQCAANPCHIGTCGTGFRCETKVTECAVVFRCPHEFVCVSDNRTLCADVCTGKECLHGFKEVGCPRCECAEDPCKENTCNPVFEECISEPVECAMGIKCPHKAKCIISSATRFNNPKGRGCSETCKNKDCPYGFQEDGCPRCTCAPNPCEKKECETGLTCYSRPSECKYTNRCPYEAECRDTACEEFCANKRCPFGFSMEGCPRCTCAPNPCRDKNCGVGYHCVTEAAKCRFQQNCYHIAVCAKNVCSDVCPEKTCPFGFMSRGCPRCNCVPNPCLSLRCPAGTGCTTEDDVCEFGNNCPKKPVCKSVCEQTSDKLCRYGYLSRGCPRSTCAPDPCMGFSCPNGQVCGRREGKCEFEYGCPYEAYCEAPPACEASCRKRCEYGMLSEGCPRCTCAPNPCQNFSCIWGSCVATEVKCEFNSNCPYKATCVAPCEDTCRKNCPFGFVSSGCPRCTCAPDPCQDRCEEGSECETNAVTCPFTNGCPHEGQCKKKRTNHRCMQKMHRGNCHQTRGLTRYYFDASRRRCVRFRYTGCGGSVNNFSSYWKCILTCALVF